MGRGDAPQLSHSDDGEARYGERTSPAARITTPFRRPPPFAAAAVIVCGAVALLAALTYWGARTFTSRAADDRAAEEAASFARHSSLLATGDAFNGYLQILRYSEDPAVRARESTAEARRDAMQQLLWLNTNKMSALAIADRSGLVLATTDITIRNVRESDAFRESRANLGPANSDIILPESGEDGYVEFTAPLRGADASVWGFLYARADPSILWRDTLNATIDGGHNVIINSEGAFSAGVPAGLLRKPWRGSPLGNGSVRADIAGIPSICGLGAIGKDTQIDHGWFVASCLPASLIQVEADRALGNQGLITVAGAVLIAVLAVGTLRIALGGPLQSPHAEAADASDDALTSADEALPGIDTPDSASGRLAPTEPEDSPGTPAVEPAPAVEPTPAQSVVLADVDALRLIDAYERRNAAVAVTLRDSIQARLMIATARAEEALRLVETDPEQALSLHRSAIAELESIRERELRLIGQELHPSLVRLGLPGALRSLVKDFEGRISIVLDVDSNVDAGSSRGGRITIDPRLRLILYRVVRDTVQTAFDGAASEITVSARRDGLEIMLSVAAALQQHDEGLAALSADAIALEAFGGDLTIQTGERLAVALRVIAPHVAQPEPEVQPAPLQFEHYNAPATIAGVGDAEDESVNDGEFDDASSMHTFALADGEPRVIDFSADPGHQAVVLPPAAKMFRLPDDEPVFVAEPADDVAVANDKFEAVQNDAAAEEDAPRVVRVESLDDVFNLPSASSEDTPENRSDSDAA